MTPDESQTPTATPPPTPDRLWAEQLASGMALLVGLLIFMAFFHPKMLSAGAAVLGPNYLSVYGWASAIGVAVQIVVHEGGTILAAWWLGYPLSFRFFGFGANATAILEYQPRRPWRDALVGMAGPVTGTLVSLILAAIFYCDYNPDKPQTLPPFFLGMACVGYFYNLFTLIPVLDLEGGWIAFSIAPQGWFFGLVAMALELVTELNLVLLCVFSFALPRLVLLITARMPRADLACSQRQRLAINISYFVLVIALAWFSSRTFDALPGYVRDTMGD
jgi:Zn-dependent protease